MLLARFPGIALAQDSTLGLPRGFSAGATVDQYYSADLRATSVRFRGTGLDRNRWSTDLGVGALFRHNAGERPLATLELGGAYNKPIPGAQVLLRMGATSMFDLSRNGGGVVGAYAGLGMIIRLTGRLGLRAEGSRHWYLAEGFPGIWVLGIGLTAIPSGPPGAGSPERVP